MDSLLTLLIYLIIAGVVLYVVQLLLGMLTLPSEVKMIVLVVISLVFLIWILRTLGFWL